MAIIVNDWFRVNAPKPIDIRYLGGALNNIPYASVADANLAISPTRRHIWLTVNINTDEYRYKDWILDTDLVLKTSWAPTKNYTKETFIITATDVLNGYIDLANTPIMTEMFVVTNNWLVLDDDIANQDYTVSGKRITFVSGILYATDPIVVRYYF